MFVYRQFNRPPHSVWLALASFAVILAACGGGGSSGSGASRATSTSGSAATSGSSTSVGTRSASGAAKTLDACTLVSDSDAATVLGEAIAKKGPTSGVGQSVCEWDSASQHSITVSVGSPGTAPGDRFTPDTAIGTPEPVPAMNGKAFYMGSGTVDFAAGGRHNSVQVVTDVTGDADKAKSEQLATQLTSRIGGAS